MNNKIVFMGTPNFAVPILKSLYQNGYPISTVYTQPPKKSNRGQKINRSPIHLVSETLNLEIRTPYNLKNNQEEKKYLTDLEADLAIVVAYGQIIPQDFLRLIKNGFINIHPSLLPKWRGAGPIQRSIMSLDKLTGISIMKLNENLDEGPICNQFSLKILDNENSEDLSNRLAKLASEKIIDSLDQILNGEVIFKEQDHSKATYAKKINKFEGKIDWSETADQIIGKINGLCPFPGAWFIFKGERYKILKAEKSYATGEKGKIISDNFEIACGTNSIKVLKIQRQGKTVQKINEFIFGSQIKKGFDLNNA